MKISNLIFMVLINSFSTAFSAENCDCTIELYIDDPDTTFTNIRDKPNGKAIAKIPAAKETFHAVYASEFKNNWWKIDSIQLENGLVRKFESGWIHRSVAVTGRDDGEFIDGKSTTDIYSSPSYASKSGMIMSENCKLEPIGCSGKWIKINHIVKKDTITGWWAPEDQCANPLTNCCNDRHGELTGVDE